MAGNSLRGGRWHADPRTPPPLPHGPLRRARIAHSPAKSKRSTRARARDRPGPALRLEAARKPSPTRRTAAGRSSQRAPRVCRVTVLTQSRAEVSERTKRRRDTNSKGPDTGKLRATGRKASPKQTPESSPTLVLARGQPRGFWGGVTGEARTASAPRRGPPRLHVGQLRLAVAPTRRRGSQRPPAGPRRSSPARRVPLEHRAGLASPPLLGRSPRPPRSPFQ